jgi:biopolymer transport protein ExbB
MIHLFHRGGLVMYPLLICSLVSVGIAVERFYYYRHHWRRGDDFAEKIRSALTAKDWEAAIVVCERVDTVVSRTVKAGLIYANCPGMGAMTVKEAFEERMAVEVTGLKRHLDYLSAIVTVAPLLGLLGTVIGMIGTFNVMDASGSGAAAITGGVGEALVATAAGLCVAVVAFFIHTFFAHRFEQVVKDAEDMCFMVLGYKRGADA